ncbi:rhodanese-like domain-containing protein [Geomonas limicola]|uniref:Rhodanese-like domain-containing protein n=1 Tax=Geomonas limicola TaxID=2740186 RepID=A0A6V8N462_9BACT|nr:rhodanese-like domain-containing protein [Geomonas limicola]GFO67322.1 rhodanese-like domain-containing protein [Geomonas limicola]
MKLAHGLKTVLVLALLVLVTVSGFAAEARNISSTQAKELLARDKKVLLVDVRTPEEFRMARLRGAKLIPLSELPQRLKELPRDRPLLVYCSVGARSSSAANLLVSRGYREVYQISDGLVGWYRNGYPIEK